MTTIVIEIGDEKTQIDVSESDPPLRCELPRGGGSLHRAHISADPAPPQDLTNAIGDMTDHLDDALRLIPVLAEATTVVVIGSIAETIASVEAGTTFWGETFILSRDAAEDVFRTLATEAADQRRCNPGLPASMVTTIAAGCCAMVAVMRRLHLESVVVRATARPVPGATN